MPVTWSLLDRRENAGISSALHITASREKDFGNYPILAKYEIEIECMFFCIHSSSASYRVCFGTWIKCHGKVGLGGGGDLARSK
jgi:hypothetical protein